MMERKQHIAERKREGKRQQRQWWDGFSLSDRQPDEAPEKHHEAVPPSVRGFAQSY